MKHLIAFITACSMFFNQRFGHGEVKGSHHEKNCNLDIQWQTTPLFYVVNFMPGDKINKNITIHNQNSSSVPVRLGRLITSTPNNLSFLNYMNLIIKQGNAPIWSGNLTQFFQNSPTQIDILPGNQTRNYSLEVEFDKTAGNQSQGQKLVFSLSVMCPTEPSPTIKPTSTPTPTPKKSKEGISDRFKHDDDKKFRSSKK